MELLKAIEAHLRRLRVMDEAVLDTSFTGKDLLVARLRAGNFEKGKNAFAGGITGSRKKILES